MLQIDSSSRTPIYEQLKQSVIRLAASGVLKPHDRLPPVRSLALELGINPNTVAKAYRELEQEGFTYSVAGIGSFISEKLNSTDSKRLETMERFGDLCRRARALGIEKEALIDEVKRTYEGVKRDD